MRRKVDVCRLLATAIVVVAGLTACGDNHTRHTVASYYGAQRVELSRVQFDDGDTFYLDGYPIRILGIDTPETKTPAVGIMEDQPYGPAAADSTRVILTRADVVEIVMAGKDVYGRRLAHVFADGELLAVKLLRYGLAYETVSHYGDSGFPDLADEILDAAADGPPPQFEPPYRWRQKHQHR